MEEGIYTVKELLVRVDNKLDLIDQKLETKADRTRVHELANDMASLRGRFDLLDATVVKRDSPAYEDLDDRVDRIEKWQSGVIVLAGWKRWVLPLAVSLLGAIAWIPTLIHQFAHH